MSDAAPILLAALGGAALALAIREAVVAVPALARYVGVAVGAFLRVGREGRTPTDVEQRRLGVIAGAGLGGLAILIGGISPLAALVFAGPTLAGVAIGRGRRRYRRAIELAVPEIATAIADALAAGGSLRGALASAGTALEGPAATELARVRADLSLGASTRRALEELGGRIASERVDALVRAALSQQRSGGDLAGLLRAHAVAAAERQCSEADARAATAQARLTGLIVVAMPFGAALLVELLRPGFVAGMLAEPAAAVMLALAAALQVGGFLAIRRLGRV